LKELSPLRGIRELFLGVIV